MQQILQINRINPYRIIIFSFLCAISMGTLLLTLPWMHAPGKTISFLDCLFTSASSICVTGLSTLDISNDFNQLGQSVVLILIQLGGLGIMTLSTFVLVLIGMKLQLKDQFVIEGFFGSGKNSSLKNLILYIVAATFLCEILGTVSLYIRYTTFYNMPFGTALFHALFHSVSAFCNAGFSLYSDSLDQFKTDPWILSTIMSLIVLGGLGFVVLYNINDIKFWKKDKTIKGKLLLQSKLVLLTSVLLITAACIVFSVIEWNHAFKGFSLSSRVTNAMFLSVTTRTAGFSTIDISYMSNASMFFIMVLMFIGASPGSTGGGIKTTTFAVLLATSLSMIKKKKEVEMFKRTIPQFVVNEAIGIVMLAMFTIAIFSFTMLISERGQPVIGLANPFFFRNILFEVVSAFGTVGLSTGITPYLSGVGKVLISIVMFAGRIGPVTIALFLSTPQKTTIKYSPENIMVG